jgi:hypothetical protein
MRLRRLKFFNRGEAVPALSTLAPASNKQGLPMETNKGKMLLAT